MPQNLDESTRNIIWGVSTSMSVVIISAQVYFHFIVGPQLQRQIKNALPKPTSESTVASSIKEPPLLLWCLTTITIMALATSVLMVPIITFTSTTNREGKATVDSIVGIGSDQQLEKQLQATSSINFCEEDFRYSTYIAELANTISSLTSYIPLSLFGLFGPAARQYKNTKRFTITYITVLMIGLGSTALHALLTAEAQGGDELPMLWFTAATSYAAIDILLYSNNMKLANTPWLGNVVLGSAVVATMIYVVGRSNFIIFHALFSLYCYSLIFAIIYILLFLKMKTIKEIVFKLTILVPLARTLGWLTVVSIWVWVSEMIYCNAVMKDKFFGNGNVPFFIWNSVIHPLWHFGSGIVAWLLVQVLLAVHGMQRGWGEPSIRWLGAPYVSFTRLQQKDL